MRRAFLFLLLVIAACTPSDERTELRIQRFFGACDADYGGRTDIAAAEGECGIMTSIINAFEAENPDIRVNRNVVFWPGYDQLTAQLAANDAPDLVTMHGSVISDYQARDLLLPLGDAMAEQGINTADFTDAARRAVEIDGQLWGLPIDTWAPLWHINMNLFREAGLVEEGEPILPTNKEELFAQAEQFRQRTGKPYFVQATANEYASFTRNFYTFIYQQGSSPYTEDGRANFTTPEAAEALSLFREIYERDMTTKNQDYSASVSGFLNGQGGVYLVGTWMVGTFEQASKETGHALESGYTVYPYPQLYGRNVTYADGHNWVMPADPSRTPEEREAALRFLEFFAEQNVHWSRTGHLPVFQETIDSADWLALPHRENLAPLAANAQPLPKSIRRQFPIETIVGQESAAAVTGAKPVDQTLADMERRINTILDNL
ncbi:extracellular solute-binding protein [Parvularcula flava]|uniref:ABC transporter substrate-binding protein n=1 Tax=Aquisalinus luteolus TaxID=1566827 RepID=A0A8J3EUD9_9PROT|nr:extracellular solute-binding protein [Aquisalinus luteolus]NHK27917.1 extracellular solute-binding protein [Aquisalinus luteolus]GGH96900.1 ABC transporter substrate-binding protein [Aquisalinus luteolus]